MARMENALESIRTVAAKMAGDYDAIMAKFLSLKTEDGICFDLSEVIPEISRPLFDLQKRMAGLFGLLKGLPARADTLVVPDVFFNQLLTQLDAVRSTLDEIDQTIAQIETNGGVAAIEKDALVVVHRVGDQLRNDFGQFFRQLWAHSESLLVNYYQFIQAAKGKSVADFSGLAAGFDARMKELQDGAKAVRKLGGEVVDTKEKIDTIAAQLEGHENEAARIKEEAANDRKSISEYLGEVTQKQAEITSVHTDAASLKGQVASYQGQFDAFQKQLDEREETIRKGQAELETLFGVIKQREKDLMQQEQDLEDLKAKGETMLAVTTNAGLAGAFSKRVEELDKELAAARWHFMWAIVFLAFSVLPAMLHVFPGLSALLGFGEAVPAQPSTGQFVAGVFARSVFMLPAAWLTVFTGGRHARLFRLREQYAHKFSIAASVDGFKKQAQSYEDAIAADTYMRLAAINPAERMEPGHAAHDDGSQHPLAVALDKTLQAFSFGKKADSGG